MEHIPIKSRVDIGHLLRVVGVTKPGLCLQRRRDTLLKTKVFLKVN